MMNIFLKKYSRDLIYLHIHLRKRMQLAAKQRHHYQVKLPKKPSTYFKLSWAFVSLAQDRPLFVLLGSLTLLTNIMATLTTLIDNSL